MCENWEWETFKTACPACPACPDPLASNAIRIHLCASHSLCRSCQGLVLSVQIFSNKIIIYNTLVWELRVGYFQNCLSGLSSLSESVMCMNHSRCDTGHFLIFLYCINQISKKKTCVELNCTGFNFGCEPWALLSALLSPRLWITINKRRIFCLVSRIFSNNLMLFLEYSQVVNGW